MTRTDLLRRLDELLELSAGTLTGSEKLEDLVAWDSMSMVGFIALADENGAKLTVRQLGAADTIEDLLKLAGGA